MVLIGLNLFVIKWIIHRTEKFTQAARITGTGLETKGLIDTSLNTGINIGV